MKILRLLANVLSGVLVIVGGLLLLGLTAAPAALGDVSYVVLSGSMSPAIPTGAVILAQPVAPSTLKVGDVIVYNRSDVNERVTHRIVDVKNDGSGHLTFTTKGDANSADDPWTVQYSGTAGKVVFAVPYVGYLDSALGSPQGRLAFLIVPVAVLAGMWLWQIWRPKPVAQAQAPVPPQPAPAAPASSLSPVGLQAKASENGDTLPVR